MIAKKGDFVYTFLNPAGFVEQDYVGSQIPQDIHNAIKKLEEFAAGLNELDRPVLILVDISRVTKIDLGPKMLRARIAGVKAMRSIGFKKAAVCGPLQIQILVNTLAMVAGVHHKIRVFDNRIDAVRWLRGKR